MTGERGAEVTLTQITRRYRQGAASVTALNRISLHVASGETVAIFGPSGSGKTSLLELIGGISHPDEGTIEVAGSRVDLLRGGGAARYRREIGFVSDGDGLLPRLSVLDNVLIGTVTAYTRPEDVESALSILEEVGIAGLADLPAGGLSGEQRHRAVYARALVSAPRLVLADEPTAGLDSRAREALLDLLAGLQARHGFTLILGTHTDSVGAICRRQIRLRDGAIARDTVIETGDLDLELQRISEASSA